MTNVWALPTMQPCDPPLLITGVAQMRRPVNGFMASFIGPLTPRRESLTLTCTYFEQRITVPSMGQLLKQYTTREKHDADNGLSKIQHRMIFGDE